jgi:ankyrin repeat protein
VNQLKQAARLESDPKKKCNAQLQLAVAYLVGYGVEADIRLAMEHLVASSQVHKVAQQILEPVSAALSSLYPESYIEGDDRNMQRGFSLRVRVCYRDSQKGASAFGVSNASEYETNLMATTLGKPLAGLFLEPRAVAAALISACRRLDFHVALALAARCDGALPHEDGPTPLHFLVMFEPQQGQQLLRTLVCGPSEDQSKPGPCQLMLDFNCVETTVFPEFCMELFGTPLHWAVRTQSSVMVKALIEAGANVNLRWTPPRVWRSEPGMITIPSYSPLDLAVCFHCDDIVDILLKYNPDTEGGDPFNWTYSAFHMVGSVAMPLSRLVLHGRGSREAARRTLDLLKSHGLDISLLDSWGRTPLVVAFSNLDIQQYIIDELLKAGATTEESPKQKETLACLAARTCFDRRFSSWKLALLVRLSHDVNSLDSHGCNALHYCALAGSAAGTNVLIGCASVDLNAKASDELENTALIYAAVYGQPEVVQMLIDAGASIDLPNKSSFTALELAVSRRNVGNALILLEAGAQTSFRIAESVPSSTVLHAAVRNNPNKSPVARQLLEKYAILRSKEHLDIYDAGGWTPLHRAAYYGDVESVGALLEAGANREAMGHYYSTSGGTALDVATKLRDRIHLLSN